MLIKNHQLIVSKSITVSPSLTNLPARAPVPKRSWLCGAAACCYGSCCRSTSDVQDESEVKPEVAEDPTTPFTNPVPELSTAATPSPFTVSLSDIQQEDLVKSAAKSLLPWVSSPGDLVPADNPAGSGFMGGRSEAFVSCRIRASKSSPATVTESVTAVRGTPGSSAHAPGQLVMAEVDISKDWRSVRVALSHSVLALPAFGRGRLGSGKVGLP